jgi:SAM-dependent methyltransferase
VRNGGRRLLELYRTSTYRKLEMEFPQGVPTIDEYQAVLGSELFLRMESFSSIFRRINADPLRAYSTRWVADPLHQWSRQWEYPFAFHWMAKHLGTLIGRKSRILDAGSGATFFPYFVPTEIPHVRVNCCDTDASLRDVFAHINSRSMNQVEFEVQDIRDMSFPDDCFDVISCISVLEHLNEVDTAIREFHRVLRQEGMLILTFDVSLDGFADIPLPRAIELLGAVGTAFRPIGELKQLDRLTSSPNILTTSYARRLNKQLLPWRHPVLSAFKRAMRLRRATVLFPEITCVCCVFVKEGDHSASRE